MLLNLDLPDELVDAIKRQAQARGLSTDRYVYEVLLSLLGKASPGPPPGTPLISGYGSFAKYGKAPTEEEIDENRAEMFRNFPRDL